MTRVIVDSSGDDQVEFSPEILNMTSSQLYSELARTKEMLVESKARAQKLFDLINSGHLKGKKKEEKESKYKLAIIACNKDRLVWHEMNDLVSRRSDEERSERERTRSLPVIPLPVQRVLAMRALLTHRQLGMNSNELIDESLPISMERIVLGKTIQRLETLSHPTPLEKKELEQAVNRKVYLGSVGVALGYYTAEVVSEEEQAAREERNERLYHSDSKRHHRRSESS